MQTEATWMSGQRQRLRRWCGRVLVGVVLLVLAVVFTGSPAGAHAELLETSPAAGAALDEPPDEVLLRFSEAVEANAGGVRVFDSDGERLDSGDVHHPEGASSDVALDLPTLGDGSYVVTWRVVSADSHPVQGAFTFQVGETGPGEATQALAEELLAAQGEDTAVGAAYAVTRALVFGALLLLVGGTAFVAGLWPAGAGHPVVRRLVACAWIGAVVSTALGIGLQGAYGAGLGLDAVVDLDVLREVVDTRFGVVWVARLALLALALPLVVALGRDLVAGRHPTRLLTASLIGVGVALMATPGLSGHASSGRLVAAAVVADTAHLAAAAVWLGGLTLLAAVVLRRDSPYELDRVVPRFSRLSFTAVVVIAGTGTFQAWRQLDSLDALNHTTYGRLLKVKLGAVAVLLGLAAISRSWVRRHYRLAPATSAGSESPDDSQGTASPANTTAPAARAASDDPLGAGNPANPDGPGARDGATVRISRLRRSVAAETAVAVVVLGVTSLLVNAVPGSQDMAQPYSTQVEVSDDLLADVVVDPAKAGPLDLHIYTLTPAGQPAPVETDVTMELRLAERDVGPLAVPLQRAGPNHFVAYGFDVPISGLWDLEITIPISDFDLATGRTQVPIR